MNPERKKFLDDLKARSAILFPAAREQLTKFISTAETNSTEENVQKLIQLKKDALSDPTKLMEFNRLRTLVVENLVTAQSNAASFFTKVNLEEDEEPMLENTTTQFMKARFIGEDGKPHMTQIIKNLARQLIPLGWVSTRELEYPLVDIYKGRVGQDVLAAAPLADGITRAMDVELWKLIKALPLTTFKVTGPELQRTFVLDPSIVPANVPTGNKLDLHAEGKFNFNVIKAIVKFYMQFGNVFGQTIVPEVVYIPAIDSANFVDDVSLTTAVLGNPALTQIFENGYVTNFGGKNLILVGDPTLDPADGYAYVRTNKPIGEWYTKPSLDLNYPANPQQIPADWIRENKGRTFMKKVFGAATPLPWTIRMLAVKYK
jgi:hypothetical protein